MNILEYIKDNPNKTAKAISKALKKDSIYTELELLNDLKFISHKDYPHRLKITIKGLMSLGE